MNVTGSFAQSSTPAGRNAFAGEMPSPQDEEEIAIGCECANPALQIDAWDELAAAEPAN